MAENKMPLSKDYCPKCHTHEMYDGSKHCGICGTKLTYQPKKDTCPDCGRTYNSTDRFCTACGKKRIVRTPVLKKE